MSFSKKDKSIIEKAIVYWQSEKLIGAEEAKSLKESIPSKGFDWKSMAYYTSIFALVSLIIAVISVFADEALLKFIDSIIDSSYLTKTIISLLISCVFYYLDIRYTNKSQVKIRYSKEVFSLLAAISFAICIGLLSFLLDMQGSPGLLILGLSFIYFALGKYQAKSIYWIFGLAALLIAYGSLTIALETGDDAIFGMNYPMRFSLFGAILIGLSMAFKQKIAPFYATTYNISIILFFAALWILSITGNYNSYNDWLAVRQYELWAYSLLLFLVSGIAIVLGIKKEDNWLKNSGIVFVFLNLYTRYFEFFWDNMHKALFFLLMAISFWLIGKRAERIYSRKN